MTGLAATASSLRSSHSASYKRKDHPTEWGTLEDILAEAAEFWKERHAAFWVFVS